MNNLNIKSIKKELIVEASQATSFKVFTEQMDAWWPRTHHIGKSPMIELVLEPGINGRWYSRHEDGSEANIGHVLQWEPYGLVVLAWQINGEFKFDPTLITEVEIQFIPEGPKKTIVKFEHKNMERLGSGGKTFESMDEGWGQILELYKAVSAKS
ncbi:SRPBCC family protein [Mucilaginibacter sp. BJC16-A38]|uniref:SRPBCC family protein n=1 Tax=Mucilaginibacter phenanthrenivorans TaxID=1234842 RepID=UPI002157CA0E|nr:SRPBCC family protein [Mucilaginibacter phenanthrenivorans]MCR8557619.1 SRPBCC family protein [Mucilaginibacter phenanthrenivorans]